MDTEIIAALAAFLGGALISLVNAVITAKHVKANDQKEGTLSVVRQVLNLIYLTAVYFVMRKLGISYLIPLIGAAIGLTVPSILFAITIAKNMKGDD